MRSIRRLRREARVCRRTRTNTLQANTNGYVDYLDHYGRTLGGGTVVPDNTAYIRRWSVEPLPTNPNNVIILQVLVTRERDRGTGDAGSVSRGAQRGPSHDD